MNAPKGGFDSLDEAKTRPIGRSNTTRRNRLLTRIIDNDRMYQKD